jgi:2-C-methyl-D-erythritol 4-phosphate cytidylyltransferase
MLAVTLQAFETCPQVDGVFLVVPSSDIGYCTEEIVARFEFKKVRKVIAGGKRRQDSVRMGIEATKGDYAYIVIHDGVRPLITPGLLTEVINTARTHRAVITALAATETVKEINRRQEVVKTHERARMYMVQTPQAFRYEDILKAHRRALREGWDEATDDAYLVERCGIPVRVVAGLERNIKITTPMDLETANWILKSAIDPVPA